MPKKFTKQKPKAKKSAETLSKTKDTLVSPKKRRGQKFGRVVGSPKEPIFGLAKTSPQTEKVLREHLLKTSHRKPKIATWQGDVLTTPNGSKVKPSAKLGDYIVCGQKTPQKAQRQAPLSKSYQKMLEVLSSPLPKTIIKTFTATVTKRILLQIKNQLHINGGRIISQAQVMNISAMDQAKKYGFDTQKTAFEWSHLCGYRFIGEKGQVKDNLVLTTKDCNTLMMFVEDEIAKLIMNLDEDDPVVITANATLLNGTNFANMIYYQCKCTKLNLELNFEFDGKSCYRPETHLEDVAKAYFDSKLALAQMKKSTSPTKPTANFNPRSPIFLKNKINYPLTNITNSPSKNLELPTQAYRASIRQKLFT